METNDKRWPIGVDIRTPLLTFCQWYGQQDRVQPQVCQQWAFEQSGLIKGVPARGRGLKLDAHWSPFQHKPYYDSKYKCLFPSISHYLSSCFQCVSWFPAGNNSHEERNRQKSNLSWKFIIHKFMCRETTKPSILFLRFLRNKKLHQRGFKEVILQKNFMKNHCLGTIYFFCHEKHQIIFENIHKSFSIRRWVEPVGTETLERATCLFPDLILLTNRLNFLKPLSIRTKAQHLWNQEVWLARGVRWFRWDFLFSEGNCKKNEHLFLPSHISPYSTCRWCGFCSLRIENNRQERTLWRIVKFAHFRQVLIWSQIGYLSLWTVG